MLLVNGIFSRLGVACGCVWFVKPNEHLVAAVVGAMWEMVGNLQRKIILSGENWLSVSTKRNGRITASNRLADRYLTELSQKLNSTLSNAFLKNVSL